MHFSLYFVEPRAPQKIWFAGWFSIWFRQLVRQMVLHLVPPIGFPNRFRWVVKPANPQGGQPLRGSMSDPCRVQGSRLDPCCVEGSSVESRAPSPIFDPRRRVLAPSRNFVTSKPPGRKPFSYKSPSWKSVQTQNFWLDHCRK